MFMIEEPYGLSQFQCWILSLTLGIVLIKRKRRGEKYIQTTETEPEPKTELKKES